MLPGNLYELSRKIDATQLKINGLYQERSDNMTEFKNQTMNFPLHAVLSSFLKQHSISKKDLHKLMKKEDYHIEQETIYKYFSSNPNVYHLPPPEFIKHFVKILDLSDETHSLLLKIRNIEEQERNMKRGAKKIKRKKLQENHESINLKRI
jgi:hypothetical protein